jgi:Helix-turn-helix domain
VGKEARKWARRQRTGGMPTKCTLLLLAEYADDETGVAWPSIRTLAEDADTDTRCMRRQLDTLEELGLIEKESGDRSHANRYRLRLDVEITERLKRPQRIKGAPSSGTEVRADNPRDGEGSQPPNVGVGSPQKSGGWEPPGWGLCDRNEGVGNPLNGMEPKEQAASSPARATPPRSHGRSSVGLTRADLAHLNATACTQGSWSLVSHWRNTHTVKYQPKTYRDINKEVDGLLRNNAEPAFIAKALVEWDARGNCSPKFLGCCYDDVVHASRGGTPVGGKRGHLYAVNGTSALKRDPTTGRIVE